MGQAQDHALGRSRRAFAVAEAAFGTQIKPVATDALKTTNAFKFDVKPDRRDRIDNRNTRDVLERITGLKTVKWDCESYLLPSGTPGTKPNIGPLLKAMFGSETFPGGTSTLYALNNVQAMGSLDLYQYFNAAPAGIWSEAAFGAFVDTFSLKFSGKDEPKCAFTGRAKDYAHTGNSTSNGVVAASATTFTVTDATALQVGSIFAGGADNNSGAGYLVTAITTGGLATFTPAAVVGWANLAAITPFTPVDTTVGNPVSFTLGSLTVDGSGVPVIDGEFKVDNGHKVFDDEAFISTIADYLPGNRKVTGSFRVKARKDQVLNFGKRWLLAPRALIFTFGSVAGKKLQISCPTAEIEFNPADIPNEDSVVFSFPFTALGNAGEDSASLTFN